MGKKKSATNRCGYTSRLRSLLPKLPGEAGIFLGSARTLIETLEPVADWKRTSADERTKHIRRFSEAVRHMDLCKHASTSSGDMLLLLDSPVQMDPSGIDTDPFTPAVPWIIYVSRTSDFVEHIRQIWIGVSKSVEKSAKPSHRPKLFEIYLLLFLHLNATRSLQSIVRKRIRALLGDSGWMPKRPRWQIDAGVVADYFQGFKKRHRLEALEKLGITPITVWQRLKAVNALRESSYRSYYDSPYRKEFEVEIEGAPIKCYREDVIEKIAEFMQGNPSKTFFCVAGGPGTGKTSLVRFMLWREKLNGHVHPHFLIQMRLGDRGSPDRILTDIAVQICPAIAHDPAFRVPTRVGESVTWINKAMNAGRGRRNICVIIDGLDETEPTVSQGSRSLSTLLREIRVPPGIRFVLFSRPTEDLRKLTGNFDITLDGTSEQNRALQRYYEDCLGPEILGRLDMPGLLRRTQGSFLYASLAVPDIKNFIVKYGIYDIEKSPDGLDERLEKEKLRLSAGPLRRGPMSKILALVAVHDGAPTIRVIADITGIEYADAAAFFEVHQHLFEMDRATAAGIRPDSHVIGFRHVELERVLVWGLVQSTGIRRAHRAIVQSYMSSKTILLPARLNEYSLRCLASHAALSDKPELVFRVVTREFAKRQLATCVSGSQTVDDCNRCIEVATNLGDLSKLLQYASLKSRILSAPKAEVLGLETYLLAKCKPQDDAVLVTETLGKPDDLLLTCVELALQHQEASITGIVQEKILASAQESEPETIEAAALSLAQKCPQIAYELAACIREPNFSKNLDTSEEFPTRTRCIFRITEILAKVSTDKAQMAIQNLSDQTDTFFALVALGAALLDRQPALACHYLKIATDELNGEFLQKWARLVLLHYLSMRMREVTSQGCLTILRELGDWTHEFANTLMLRDMVDVKIAEDKAFWMRVRRTQLNGWTYDLITWRLIELGLLDTNELRTIVDPALADYGRAACLCAATVNRSEGSLGFGLGIESDSGARLALGKLLANIPEDAKARAKRITEMFLEEVRLCDTSSSLQAAFAAFDSCITVEASARAELACLCLDGIDNLPFELQPVARRTFGGLLRNGWERVSRERHRFFFSFISELGLEHYRVNIARTLVSALSEKDCAQVARQRVLYGLGDGSVVDDVNALLTVSSQVALLLLLARRIGPAHISLARTLVQEATSLALIITEDSRRNEAVSDALETALRLSPSFIWEVYDAVRCEFLTLHLAIKRALGNILVARDDPTEQFLRLELERFVRYGEQEANKPSHDKNKLALLISRGFHERDTAELSPKSPSRMWLNDIEGFIRGYVERFRSAPTELGYMSDYLIDFVAPLDWDTYMLVARDAELGPVCFKGIFNRSIPWDKLRPLFARAVRAPEQLVDDMRCLQNVRAPHELRKNQRLSLSPLTENLISAVAKCQPRDISDLVATFPVSIRSQVTQAAVSFDGHAPSTLRRDKGAAYSTIQGCDDPKLALFVKARQLLKSLKEQHVRPTGLAALTKQAMSLCDADELLQIGRVIREFDENAGLTLISEAATRAMAQGHVKTLVDCLSDDKISDWTEYAAFVEEAACLGEASKDWESLKDIAILQSRMAPEKALWTFAKLQGNERGLDEALGSIIERIRPSNFSSLEKWQAQLSGIHFLSDVQKDRATCKLIENAIGVGCPVTLEFVDRIVSSYWKSKALARLALKANADEVDNVLLRTYTALQQMAAQSVTPLSDEWIVLAESFLEHYPDGAAKCIREALFEALRYDQDINFTSCFRHAATIALNLPLELGKYLATDFMRTVEHFPYGRDPFLDAPWMKFQAYFTCAIYIYAVEPSMLEAFLPDVAVAWASCARWSSGDATLGESLKHLSQCRGQDATQRFLTVLFGHLHESGARSLADYIANGLCEHPLKRESPLGKYGIHVRSLAPEYLAILEPLIPQCSSSQQMLGHLICAVSYAGTDDRAARKHIIQATASEVDANEHIELLDPRQDVLLTAAYLGDLSDCMQVASKLTNDPQAFDRTAARIFQYALCKVQSKQKFLNELIGGIWAIEPILLSVMEG